MTKNGRNVVEIRCDPRDGVAVWLSELTEKVPSASLSSVLCGLVQTLLRARGWAIKFKAVTRHTAAEGSSDLNSEYVSYHIAVAYHIAIVPSLIQLKKCKNELITGFLPVLLVPRSRIKAASKLAERVRIKRKMTIFSIEDFVTNSVLFQSIDQSRPIFKIWLSIIASHNGISRAKFTPTIKILKDRRGE